MEIDEARRLISDHIEVIDEYEYVPVSASCGRIVFEDIRAHVSVPHFPKSAMDGYAVRAEDLSEASKDTPVTLRVICEKDAGDDPSLPRETGDIKGTAVRIMTGAQVPEGYDTVVKQEDTDLGEDEVRIFTSPVRFTNYCRPGEDIREGDIVIDGGRRIGRIEAGILSSLGMSRVKVLRTPRAAVIATGSELIRPGEKLTDGKIYSSLSTVLRISLESAGFDVSDYIAKDDEEEISDLIENALIDCDLVITTGGVSVGKKDLVPLCLDKIGAVKIFEGIDIRPGSPTTGSVKDGKFILSLSGNPYAAIACFDYFIGHIVYALTDSIDLIPVETDAVVVDDYPKVRPVRMLIRAFMRNGRVYLPARDHQSSVFSNLRRCNCYIDLPAGEKLNAGDTVKVIKIPGGPA